MSQISSTHSAKITCWSRAVLNYNYNQLKIHSTDQLKLERFKGVIRLLCRTTCLWRSAQQSRLLRQWHQKLQNTALQLNTFELKTITHICAVHQFAGVLCSWVWVRAAAALGCWETYMNQDELVALQREIMEVLVQKVKHGRKQAALNLTGSLLRRWRLNQVHRVLRVMYHSSRTK